MALKATILYDEVDKELLNKCRWKVNISGYLVNNRGEYFHKLILNAPKGQQVDHINRNKLDNRRSNLRLCTHQQNMRNQDKYILKRGATSKYKGVSKKGNRYVSIIYLNRKPIRLGSYKTEDEAGLAYNIKAKELFGEFAVLNEVPKDTKLPIRYKGVQYEPKRKKWKATIMIDGKQVQLGRYTDERDAFNHRRSEEIRLNKKYIQEWRGYSNGTSSNL